MGDRSAGGQLLALANGYEGAVGTGQCERRHSTGMFPEPFPSVAPSTWPSCSCGLRAKCRAFSIRAVWTDRWWATSEASKCSAQSPSASGVCPRPRPVALDRRRDV